MAGMKMFSNSILSMILPVVAFFISFYFNSFSVSFDYFNVIQLDLK